MGWEHLEGRGNVLFMNISPGHSIMPGTGSRHMEYTELKVVLGMPTSLFSFLFCFVAILNSTSPPSASTFLGCLWVPSTLPNAEAG